METLHCGIAQLGEPEGIDKIDNASQGLVARDRAAPVPVSRRRRIGHLEAYRVLLVEQLAKICANAAQVAECSVHLVHHCLDHFDRRMRILECRLESAAMLDDPRRAVRYSRFERV